MKKPVRVVDHTYIGRSDAQVSLGGDGHSGRPDPDSAYVCQSKASRSRAAETDSTSSVERTEQISVDESGADRGWYLRRQ